ncbi:MAG: diguanylate cyclase, partial [Anaerolineaceae bacterium]|nr:diguanylate cyclase [Anaerolineaceae bacterium]
VVVLDSQIRVVDINPAALELLDLESSQVIGQPAKVVLQDWEKWIDQYQFQSVVNSEINQRVKGEDRCFDLRISPLKDHKNLESGRMIVLHDITERKRMQDQLQDSLAEVQALQNQLYEEAIRDPLTGLYNRRHLEKMIQHELPRARRHAYPICFVMIDIDHFKMINDSFGHSVGDHVLQEVSKLLLAQTRSEDFIYRYGGEEFLVLMTNIPLEDARLYAERLRNLVEEAIIQINNPAAEINVTISLGIAGYNNGETTVDELLRAADKALYSAKTQGRNRVIVAETNL